MLATRPSVLVDRIQVFVAASDPVSRAGIASQLRIHHGLEMVEERARAELGMVKPNEVFVQIAH